MKREFTKEQEESFREGRISAFKEIQLMCQNKNILVVKNKANRGTPQQLTDGGKIISLCNVINECKQRAEKAINYKSKV